jgi:hypothetical protein
MTIPNTLRSIREALERAAKLDLMRNLNDAWHHEECVSCGVRVRWSESNVVTHSDDCLGVQLTKALAALQSLERPRMSATVINGYELAMTGSEFGLNGDDPSKFLDRLVKVGVLAPAIEQPAQDGVDIKALKKLAVKELAQRIPVAALAIEFTIDWLQDRNLLHSPTSSAPDGEPRPVMYTDGEMSREIEEFPPFTGGALQPARGEAMKAADELVKAAKSYVATVITLKNQNTLEWMEYIVERTNEFCDIIGEPDRIKLDRYGQITIDRKASGGGEV